MGARSRDLEQAMRLMQAFVEHTGLRGAAPNRRYLWTDAFAVCNFVALARRTSNPAFLKLALELVERVHHTLGRYRADGARHGWISGLSEEEGARHPTRGGLRIGKPLPERGPAEPVDRELEWERDGQYFHYLTKWMLALDALSRATGERRFNLWARELLEVAHERFSVRSFGLPPRLYWKMSTDLSRPLVASSGQHDALDGLLTAEVLAKTAAELGVAREGPDLRVAVRDFSLMLEGAELTSSDPLGLGELLSSACRAARRLAEEAHVAALVPRLLEAALDGLEGYVRLRPLEAPAPYRLAFRELGLAIGLSGAAELERRSKRVTGVRRILEGLRPFLSLSETIRSFWLEPEHRRASTWTEHRDINEVMLATALVPDGYLN